MDLAGRLSNQAFRRTIHVHACDPDNRLVARSLETRWEEKLRELKDAEAQLAEHATPAPEPSREQIEALARDLPALWAANSTSDKNNEPQAVTIQVARGAGHRGGVW